MQSRLPSINTQTVLFTARVDAQVAVNSVYLFHVHVIYKPHFPHRVLRAVTLERLVPFGGQRVGDVRPKVWCDGWLVLVKPVLNTHRTENRCLKFYNNHNNNNNSICIAPSIEERWLIARSSNSKLIFNRFPSTTKLTNSQGYLRLIHLLF